MLQIGDIVKHSKIQSRVGVVIAIDKQTIVVNWFDSRVPYRYFPHALIKVS